MSTTYPGVLPRPQRSGYHISAAAMATATARDRTVPRCRRIGLAPVYVVSLTWIFTVEQFAVFCGWWRYDLAQGSALAQIILMNGFDDITYVRFLCPYQAEDLDGKWKVSVQAELPTYPRMSQAALEALIPGGSATPYLPAWPVAYLGQVLRAGNSRSPVDRSARASLAAGPQVARQRHHHLLDACPIAINFTDAQLTAFDAWWFYFLNQGTAWFTLTLLGENDAETHKARVNGGYQAAAEAGNKWHVTMKLDLDDPPHA
jgi:hypothetical protein